MRIYEPPANALLSPELPLYYTYLLHGLHVLQPRSHLLNDLSLDIPVVSTK